MKIEFYPDGVLQASTETDGFPLLAEIDGVSFLKLGEAPQERFPPCVVKEYRTEEGKVFRVRISQSQRLRATCAILDDFHGTISPDASLGGARLLIRYEKHPGTPCVRFTDIIPRGQTQTLSAGSFSHRETTARGQTQFSSVGAIDKHAVPCYNRPERR